MASCQSDWGLQLSLKQFEFYVSPIIVIDLVCLAKSVHGAWLTSEIPVVDLPLALPTQTHIESHRDHFQSVYLFYTDY